MVERESNQEVVEVGEECVEGIKYRVERVDPRGLVLLKKNAHYMPAEMYNKLVSNIRRDGCLTSTPVCYTNEDGEIEVLSGNHRTKASIQADLDLIDILLIETKLTKDQALAIQLSHNSLNGLDNADILKELWAEIGTVEDKEYSGFSKEMMDDLNRPLIPPVDARLDLEQITILFLPEEVELLQSRCEEIGKRFYGSEQIFLDTIKGYDNVAEAIKAICKSEKVHNFATVFEVMSRLALERLAEMEAEAE